MRLPEPAFIDYFTLGVMYVLCASIAVNIETRYYEEQLLRWWHAFTSWFWATLATLVAAESDASFAEDWRSTFYEGRHRRGTHHWKVRWASYPTQAWPTLAAWGDNTARQLLAARPTICTHDWWKDLRERDAHNSRGAGWDREDLARSKARRAARREGTSRPRRAVAPRRTLTVVSSTG